MICAEAIGPREPLQQQAAKTIEILQCTVRYHCNTVSPTGQLS